MEDAIDEADHVGQFLCNRPVLSTVTVLSFNDFSSLVSVNELKRSRNEEDDNDGMDHGDCEEEQPHLVCLLIIFIFYSHVMKIVNNIIPWRIVITIMMILEEAPNLVIALGAMSSMKINLIWYLIFYNRCNE